MLNAFSKLRSIRFHCTQRKMFKKFAANSANSSPLSNSQKNFLPSSQKKLLRTTQTNCCKQCKTIRIQWLLSNHSLPSTKQLAANFPSFTAHFTEKFAALHPTTIPQKINENWEAEPKTNPKIWWKGKTINLRKTCFLVSIIFLYVILCTKTNCLSNISTRFCFFFLTLFFL